MKIDVAIISTLRADVLWQTLRSFYINMISKLPIGTEVCAVANIDAVGVSSVNDVEKAIKFFFDRNVINVSEKPSFPAAFKWVWTNINSSDFVIHLEDDWLLKRPADATSMISILNSEDDLALLRLPLFQSQENKMKNWNLMYPWNGRYFECPKEYVGRAGFCGHPSLIKSQFVRNCAKYIKTNLNPEKQFHELNVALKTEVCKWRYGVYGSPNEAALIEDIGRKWMIKNNFRKSGLKGWFKNWVEIKGAENEQKA